MSTILGDDEGVPPAPSSRRLLGGKIFSALLVAGIGVGASAASCVGQSFSLRQARALEGIEQQLRQLNTSCVSLQKEGVP